MLSINHFGVLCFIVSGTLGLQSRWGYSFDKATSRKYSIFPNYLFKGASVTIGVVCQTTERDVHIKIDWVLQEVDCMEQMYKIDTQSDLAVVGILDSMASSERIKRSGNGTYQEQNDNPTANQETSAAQDDEEPTEDSDAKHKSDSAQPDRALEEPDSTQPDRALEEPDSTQPDRALEEDSSNPEWGMTHRKKSQKTQKGGHKFRTVAFQRSNGSKSYPCQSNNIIYIQDETAQPYHIAVFPADVKIAKLVQMKDAIQMFDVVKNGKESKTNNMISHEVTRAWEDGMYHLALTVYATNPDADFHASGMVQMHGRYGFLSAIDWPLLPFNSVMALLYLGLATMWIIIWARSHKHTLKIHVVMGFIAVAGAMCHVLQFVEQAAINSNGGGVKGLLWFARILVAAQISVLYLLLMVVSSGYGITRPKLSRSYIIPTAILAGINFILDSAWKISVDESLKIQYNYPSFTKAVLWMKAAALVVIFAWILAAAVTTFIHLCSRRHASTKLVVFSIYTVVVAVVFVSILVVFGLSMGWMQACRKNWQLEWLFSSFSNMASFLMLIVLMWLWRPVDTAQSYAFSPLTDADDALDEFLADDEDDSEVEEFDMEKTKIRLAQGAGDCAKYM